MRSLFKEVDAGGVISQLLKDNPLFEDWTIRLIDRVGVSTPFPLTKATIAGVGLWKASRWYIYARKVHEIEDRTQLNTRFLAGLVHSVSELCFIEARDADGPNGEPGALWHDLGELGLPHWMARHPNATVREAGGIMGTQLPCADYRASILVLMFGEEALGLLDVDLQDVINPPETFQP